VKEAMKDSSSRSQAPSLALPFRAHLSRSVRRSAAILHRVYATIAYLLQTGKYSVTQARWHANRGKRQAGLFAVLVCRCDAEQLSLSSDKNDLRNESVQVTELGSEMTVGLPKATEQITSC
jgi:hypothetical protein